MKISKEKAYKIIKDLERKGWKLYSGEPIYKAVSSDNLTRSIDVEYNDWSNTIEIIYGSQHHQTLSEARRFTKHLDTAIKTIQKYK